MMKSKRVSEELEFLRSIVDTNIFASGLINRTGAPAKLIQAWKERLFDIVISKEIFKEYEEALLGIDKIDKVTTIELLDSIRELGIWVSPEETIAVCRDKSDNKFLECAVAGNAKYLVTKNISHFPKRYENVEVIRVGNFLAQIGR